LLRGLEWLLDNGFDSKVVWEWNPRQTGSGIEPDLRGSVDVTILVSAEASTSENPLGMVDSRMKDTLEKLSRMEGQKFYFVGTAGMAMRAGTKTARRSGSSEWSRFDGGSSAGSNRVGEMPLLTGLPAYRRCGD
jgi:hypothetical protein